MDIASKIEKFEGFLEGIKSENPVLVESILSGFKSIVEAGVPSHWSDEAWDEEMSNEIDDAPLVEKKGQIELAPYVFAEVINEDGKITIWKRGFGDLAVSNSYQNYDDIEDLVAEAKAEYTRKKTTGKYSKDLVDDPKEVIEMNLTEAEESDRYPNISYEIGSVTDKQPNGDGGQFVKVESKNDGRKYLIMTDNKHNGPWKIMIGLNNGKIIASKSKLWEALSYINDVLESSKDESSIEKMIKQASLDEDTLTELNTTPFKTVKDVIDVLGEYGDKSSDEVIAFIKGNDSKISDELKANLFGYYHIPDEDYVDENGNWIEDVKKFDNINDLISYYVTKFEHLGSIDAEFDDSVDEISKAVKLSLVKSDLTKYPIDKVLDKVFLDGDMLMEASEKDEWMDQIDNPLRDELPGTTYTLEIDPDWQKAVDFIGHRYSTGHDFYDIIIKYLGADDEWGAGKTVTAKLPEHKAWELMDLFQTDDGELDPEAFGLLGGTARESLIRFIDQIV